MKFQVWWEGEEVMGEAASKPMPVPEPVPGEWRAKCDEFYNALDACSYEWKVKS